MEIRDDAMNTGWMIVTNETRFSYKTTTTFSYNLSFYRITKRGVTVERRVATVRHRKLVNRSRLFIFLIL